MLKGKTVVVGVTGGIAAYKIAELAGRLVKAHADVHVIMTENAREFITPLTFETLTGNKCIVDTFDRNFKWDVRHISLAKKADAFVVAPATANIIAKMAHGMADDMLSTTVLAAECPKIVAPSMNTAMFENKITSDNIEKLREYGFHIIEPDSGMLACGDTGKGRLPSIDIIFHNIIKNILYKGELEGLKILVTAGATKEKIDPVRYIGNHSSGKMGCAVAYAGALRGAEVTLIGGDVEFPSEAFLSEVEYIKISSADDMFKEVEKRFCEFDFIVKAAAVADYKPSFTAEEKIKKTNGDLNIHLVPNVDILAFLGENKKEHQVVCGFSMETENLIENSKAKLKKKNADMIAANNLKQAGAGFKTDTNIITLITEDEIIELPLLPKIDIGHIIIDKMSEIKNKNRKI